MSVSARILAAVTSISCMSTLSVISNFEGAGCQACFVQDPSHLLDEARILELAARQIDAHDERPALSCPRPPLSGLATGFSQHPQPYRLDEAAFLGDRMNWAGEMGPRVGCCQRSNASTSSMSPSINDTIGW